SKHRSGDNLKDTRRQKRAKIKHALPPGTQVIDLGDDSPDIHAGSTPSCTTTTSPAINLPQAELASAGLSLLRPPMEVTELHGKLLTTAATIQLPMPTIAAPPPT